MSTLSPVFVGLEFGFCRGEVWILSVWSLDFVRLESGFCRFEVWFLPTLRVKKGDNVSDVISDKHELLKGCV